MKNSEPKKQHINYVEQSEMELLANRLSLYIEENDEIKRMFHNYKGTGNMPDVIESMITDILKLDKKS